MAIKRSETVSMLDEFSQNYTCPAVAKCLHVRYSSMFTNVCVHCTCIARVYVFIGQEMSNIIPPIKIISINPQFYCH